MRAVFLKAPEGFLEERRRLGHDRWDEVWNGVLHMVPPPSSEHQWVGSQLLVALAQVARQQGLRGSYETGVFRPGREDRDYRVPDLVYYRKEQATDRGVVGRAELVIEILSPDDESRDKLPFYAELGIPEVWLVDPQTRQVELYLLRGAAYHVALPDAEGALRSPALGVTLRTLPGPHLAVVTPEATTEI